MTRQEQFKKEKEEHYTKIINGMLQRELSDLKEIVTEIEKTLNADMIDIDTKAIRVLETMQKIRFNTSIFRELQEMKKEN